MHFSKKIVPIVSILLAGFVSAEAHKIVPSNPVQNNPGYTECHNKLCPLSVFVEKSQAKMGIVKGKTVLHKYDLGSAPIDKLILVNHKVELVASPKEGFVFDKWSDGVKEKSRTIVVDKKTTLVAYFKSADSKGGISSSSGEAQNGEPSNFGGTKKVTSSNSSDAQNGVASSKSSDAQNGEPSNFGGTKKGPSSNSSDAQNGVASSKSSDAQNGEPSKFSGTKKVTSSNSSDAQNGESSKFSGTKKGPSSNSSSSGTKKGPSSNSSSSGTKKDPSSNGVEKGGSFQYGDVDMGVSSNSNGVGRGGSSNSNTKLKLGSDGSDKKGKDGNVTAIPTSFVPRFSVETVAGNVQVSGARVGAAYELFNMQGRSMLRGHVENPDFSLTMPYAGSYMLRIANQERIVVLR